MRSLMRTVALAWAAAGWLCAAPVIAQMEDAAEPAATAAPDTRQQDFGSLDQDVQALKQEVLDLNRDLFVLEEELLFPANTQVAVFVSVDIGTLFELDSVMLTIDDKEVMNYLYTEREAEALIDGGVHRLYVGNLKVGPHELVATFTGDGPSGRDYRRATAFTLEKGVGAKLVELKVSDFERRRQPEFIVDVWE